MSRGRITTVRPMRVGAEPLLAGAVPFPQDDVIHVAPAGDLRSLIGIGHLFSTTGAEGARNSRPPLTAVSRASECGRTSTTSTAARADVFQVENGVPHSRQH